MDVMRLLIANKADVNTGDRQWQTALHGAAGSGRVAAVRLLLENGADIDTRSWDDATPLLATAKAGYADVARLLLGHGADPNACGKDGKTALHHACEAGYTEMVTILLADGRTDINARSKFGTPLEAASRPVDEEDKRRFLFNFSGLKRTKAKRPADRKAVVKLLLERRAIQWQQRDRKALCLTEVQRPS